MWATEDKKRNYSSNIKKKIVTPLTAYLESVQNNTNEAANFEENATKKKPMKQWGKN